MTFRSKLDELFLIKQKCAFIIQQTTMKSLINYLVFPAFLPNLKKRDCTNSPFSNPDSVKEHSCMMWRFIYFGGGYSFGQILLLFKHCSLQS